MGLWPTLALVAATGFLGAVLARREGTRTLIAVQSDLAQGRVPTRAVLSGAAVLAGAAFLLTPGVLTDSAGFFLLLPQTRELVFRWVQARMTAALRQGTLRVATWNVSGPRPASGASETGPSRGRETHGRDAAFPFEFGTRSGREQARKDDEDCPPRPGEIIQD